MSFRPPRPRSSKASPPPHIVPPRPPLTFLFSFFFFFFPSLVFSRRLIEDLRRENATLKDQLSTLSKQDGVQQMVRENDILRSSIMTFKQEVETQARRYGKSSMLSTSYAVGRGGQQHPHHLARSEAVFANKASPPQDVGERLRQLEAENQKLKAENHALAEKVTEYRERWKTLREGAKKRMDIQSQLRTSTSQVASPVASSRAGDSDPTGSHESAVFYSLAETN